MNTNKSKKIIFMICIISILVCLSVNFVKAYYSNTSSFSILASLIGDFDTGDGDINMMFYKESGQGDYVRTFAAPSLGYEFNDSLTTCTITCSNSDPTASCYYNYNTTTKKMSLTSDNKVTCKFYFDETEAADINVYVLKEDENGTYEYNLKTYSLTNSVPAYGYEYTNHYSCDNNSTLTYTAETRSFSVQATEKDDCYVYFDKDNKTADVIVNIYIKNSNNTYEKVPNIPQNKTYTLSQSQTSSCTDANATVSYTNGSILISAEEKQTCNVYLDLVQ